MAALGRLIDELEHQLGMQQDIHAVRGCNMPRLFHRQVAIRRSRGLVFRRGRVWFLGGIYKGKAGIRRLYIERFRNNFTEVTTVRATAAARTPAIQMIVDVAPDRRTASVRGRSLMQAGLHETASGRQRAWWEGGLYENRYVRENGVWKILRLGYYPHWHGSFQDGWARTPLDFVPMASVTYPEDPLGPDALLDPVRGCGGTDIVPFTTSTVPAAESRFDNRRARGASRTGDGCPVRFDCAPVRVRIRRSLTGFRPELAGPRARARSAAES